MQVRVSRYARIQRPNPSFCLSDNAARKSTYRRRQYWAELVRHATSSSVFISTVDGRTFRADSVTIVPPWSTRPRREGKEGLRRHLHMWLHEPCFQFKLLRQEVEEGERA